MTSVLKGEMTPVLAHSWPFDVAGDNNLVGAFFSTARCLGAGATATAALLLLEALDETSEDLFESVEGSGLRGCSTASAVRLARIPLKFLMSGAVATTATTELALSDRRLTNGRGLVDLSGVTASERASE
jgi:hypothetical protein